MNLKDYSWQSSSREAGHKKISEIDAHTNSAIICEIHDGKKEKYTLKVVTTSLTNFKHVSTGAHWCLLFLWNVHESDIENGD